MERRMNRISSSSSTSSSSYEITRRAPPIPQRGMCGSSARSSPSLNTSARNSPNSGSARNSPVPSSFTTDKPQSTPLLMHPNCRNRGVIPEDRVDNTPISSLLHDDNMSVHHTGSKSLSSHPSITSSHSHESYLSSSSSNISSEVSMRSRSSHYSSSSTRTDASGMSFMVSDSESDEDDRYEEISENLKQPTLEQQRILQMDKKERKVFYIAREIMTTERSFVQVLRLVNLDLRVSIEQMSSRLSQPVVPVGVVNQLFKALPVLQKFNEDLLKDLENRIDKWESNPCIADIFVMKGQFLKLYSPYIKDFEAMSKSLDDARKKFPGFEQAIQQFEALPKCGNLSLRHFLLRPIQRIPQYRLLLTDYKKHLDEDAPDYQDTIKALDVVSQVAEHANDGMRDGDNFSKLWVIQHSLVGHFEVMKPGRTFYKEGQLNKLSRKEMQPRMFFLFSDVLLYTTPTGSGTYKLNNVLPLKDIRVSQPTKEDFQNEFSISSTHRSFTISASTANEKEEWLESLHNAIKVYARKQTSFGSVRSHKSNNGEAVLGSCAPVWIPDARVSMCALCTAAFTITFRRHHCRACGKVICGYCSDYRAPLGYLKYKSARVCKICYEALSKDIEGADDNMLFGDQERDDDGRKLDKQNIMKRFKNVRISSFGKGKLRSKGSRPKVLKEVTANTEDSDMSGYLHIWRAKKWKQRWFVLKGHALYTYRASEDSAAKSSTVLLGYQIRPIDTNYRTQKRPWYEGVEASLVFELYHHGTEAMIFRTDSAASTQKWMKAMSDATVPGEIE